MNGRETRVERRFQFDQFLCQRDFACAKIILTCFTHITAINLLLVLIVNLMPFVKYFLKYYIIHTLLFEIHLIFALIISQTSQACLKFIASLVKLIHWVANSWHILLTCVFYWCFEVDLYLRTSSSNNQYENHPEVNTSIHTPSNSQHKVHCQVHHMNLLGYHKN